LEYTNNCDEMASTHVMIEVMICVENGVKGEGKKNPTWKKACLSKTG
jgi:hypothetical protein